MKKVNKFLAFALAFAMVLTLVPGFEIPVAVAADVSDGSSDTEAGVAENVEASEVAHLTEVPEGYVGIYTKEDLNNVRNNLAGNYILMNDIEFTDADFSEGGDFYNNGAGWAPIGTDSNNSFTGIFDGNGYAIKNLYVNVNSSSTVYAGLFGYSTGTIKNLGMVDGEISAETTSGFAYVGGIVGRSLGSVTNCYNTGVVGSSYAAGGIVGFFSSSDTVSNCYNAGNVQGRYAGGIVGYDSSITVTNCYNAGNVEGSDSGGGIVGWLSSSSTVTNCYNTGDVEGSSYYAGGIVGFSGGIVTNCYNIGNVEGPEAGGIVGRLSSSGTVTNCYNLGTVKGSNAGAIVGQLSSSDNWGGWLYPADDNGAIGSDVYYRIKEGEKLTYTVKAEKNKMPTKLRLTVFNRDNVDITEDIWKTFDMKITKTSAVVQEPFNGTEITGLTWVNGTRYGGAEPGNGNGKYICTTIPVVPGDKVKIERGGVWNLWLFTGVGGSVPSQYSGTYRGGSGTRKVNSGEVLTFPDDVTELHITVYLEGGAAATVEGDEFKTLDIKFYKESLPTEEPPATSDADEEVVTAEWKPGQFYDSAEPVANTKCYYTVIPCAEGDVFEFDASTGNWGGWMYPADDNGAIGSDVYYQVKEGEKLTYTVKAEDGKMPTKLRLTVFNRDNVDITEDIWKTFDMKITKTSAVVQEPFNGTEITGLTWVNGTRYGNAEPGDGVGKYICTTIPVVPGDKVKIERGGVWNLWLYTGVGGSVPSQYTTTYRGGAGDRKINSGEVLTFPDDVTELHITVYIEGGAAATVEGDEFKTLDIKFYKESLPTEEPYRGTELTLDWKGGAFYHTAEPNTALATTRRYVVVPCTEGETIKVVSPSNGWQIWVCPADENGSIEGKYYGLKNGDTYTVEAINGKMPTALRITAHLLPDGVLSDDAWAARDLKIFKKSFTALDLDWKPGSFYNGAAPGGDPTTRRYAVIPCTEGETIKVVSPSNGWQVWIYPADENGSIESRYIGLKNGDTYTVEAINGRMPTALRITAHLLSNGLISDDTWAARDLVILSDRVIEEAPPATSDADEEVVTAEWKPGQFYDSAEPVANTKCYYTVIPCAEGDVFEFYASSGTVTNCYYLDNVSKGVGSGTDTCIKCTAAQMRQQSTFVGFDFDTVWTMAGLAEYPFPELQSVPMVALPESTTEFAGGTGSSVDPYLIQTKQQLNNVRNYLGSSFKLLNDIVFTEADFAEGGAFYNNGAGWAPIGTDSNNSFTGIFDGNGYAIKNLYVNIKGSSDVYTGLFGYSDGTIKNLGMIDGEITVETTSDYAYAYAGGIVGRLFSSGTVTSCYNTGSVTATSESNSVSTAGGIVGYLSSSGTVTNCYNTGTVEGFSDAGGIVGHASSGSVANCYNTGSVAGYDVGGIVGSSSSTVTNCYNTGSVDGYDSVGGIVGFSDGIVTNCYNIGNVEGSESGGGIVGRLYSSGTVTNCYNTGTVEGSSCFAGGIVGLSDGIVTNCYNIGNVEGTKAGGIVGSSPGTVTNCYNTGIVEGSEDAGGIVGYLYSSGTVTNCYYLDNMSIGVGNGTDTCTKCTAAQMRQQATFVGFDFDTVWTMAGLAKYPFPELQSVPMVDLPGNTTEFAGGTGSSVDPYLIQTKQQLNNVRNYLGSSFKLLNDIVFTEADFAEGGAFYNNGVGWAPIGTDSNNSFTGIFDGNGYAIKNLYVNINSSSTVYAGLFGYSTGTIKNLGMIDGEITAETTSDYAYAYAGGIVGSSSGTVTNCYNVGTVDGSIYAGGIVGLSFGTVTNCYNTGSVEGSDAGGIVGYLYSSGTVTNCYNVGTVDGSYAGGIVGRIYSSGTVTNCYYLASEPKGVGYGTDTCTKCTAAQMKQQATFVGFDFDTVWTMAGLEEYPFPELQPVPMVALPDNTTEFAGGTGFVWDPYLIQTKQQLNNVRNYLGASFKLLNDIVFTEADFAEGGAFYNNGAGWAPIGTDSNNSFTGIFDGNGYAIKNLYVNINSSSTVYAGLFGYSTGTIKNLGMIDGEISAETTSGSACVGGIVGRSLGSVTNCYNTGNVEGSSVAGGIVGTSYGTVTNCYNVGTVDGSYYAGGIVGCISSSGTVTNCYNVGTVAGSFVGGIVGESSGTVTDCYNVGTVAGSFVGGIVGRSSGTVTNCYNVGTVKGSSYAGGIVGYISSSSSGTVTNCYNVGTVDGSYAGGIVGCIYSSGTVTNCYNVGTVAGSFVGGIVGRIISSGTVTNCYNVGTVKGSSYAGGIVGYIRSSGTVTNCYYLDNMSIGVGNGTDTCTKCTAEHLMQQATFVGFDFDTVWTMAGNADYLYPELQGVEMQFTKELESIAVTTNPSKTGYLEAKDLLDLAGGKLALIYNNGTTEEIDLSKAKATGFDNTKVGEQTLTVTYDGKTCEFKVEVIAKSLVSIEMTTAPTKVTYLEEKDLLDLSGGKLTLTYDNGTTEEINLFKAKVTGFDNTKVGEQTLTATYEGKTCVFKVEIIAKTLVSIEVTTAPTKVEYLEAKDPLDLAGGKLTLAFNNDTTEEIDLSEATVTGFNNAKVGEQRLRVVYNGKTTTLKVEIIAKSLASIAVTKNPTKGEYLEAKDALDLTGGKLTLSYNNDTTEVIDLSNATVAGFDNTKVGEQTLTVTYNGKTTTFKVEIIAKSLVSIAVTKNPTKVEYLEAKDLLDLAGGKLTLTYNNGTTKEIKLSEATVTGFDNTKIGEQTLIVIYEGNVSMFKVNVIAKTLSSIAVTTKPSKLTYLEGDSFNKTGMVVAAYYNNGTSSVISDYTVSGYTSTPGTKTITVSYGGKTTTFNVEVVAKSLASISVTTNPAKTEYLESKDFLDLAGGKLTLSYNNGTTTEIDLSKATVTGFDHKKVGEQTLTVTYGGKTCEFKVEVIAKSLVSIAVTAAPSKTDYLESKDVLDLTGGKLTLSYNNGTAEKINLSEATVTGFDNTKVGAQTLTVTYNGKTTTFKVKIIAKALTSIAVTAKPSKLTYLEGESFDKSGMVVTAYYNNNTSAVITDYTVSGYSSTVGTKTVTVSYGGKTATFTVTVKSRVLSSITSSKFTVSGGNISKIPAGTTVSALLAGINEGAYCKVYKGNSEVSGSAVVGTGMVVKLLDGNTVKASCTVVVTGDTNGDGNITITDMIAIKAHVLKKTLLSGAAAKAADTNGDNSISITDFIQVKAKILGKGTITAR